MPHARSYYNDSDEDENENEPAAWQDWKATIHDIPNYMPYLPPRVDDKTQVTALPEEQESYDVPMIAAPTEEELAEFKAHLVKLLKGKSLKKSFK